MAIKPAKVNFTKAADTSFDFGFNVPGATVKPPKKPRASRKVRNAMGRLVSNNFAAAQGS